MTAKSEQLENSKNGKLEISSEHFLFRGVLELLQVALFVLVQCFVVQ